jgi:two-component system NtrC family response regulator
VPIRLPPLRERAEDIPALVRHFLALVVAEGLPQKSLDAAAMERLKAYRWPGNVRELENKIKGAVILAEGTQVRASDLELDAQIAEPPPINLRQVRDQAERQALQRALSIDGGNMSKAAELLGISRPTLYDLMNKHGLK